MPPYKHRIRIGILLHGGLEALCEILLVRRVLDNGDPQAVKVSQVADLVAALGYALDLLDLLDLKAYVGPEVALDQQRDEDGPLRVRVDAAAGAALKGGVEEGRAGGGLVGLAFSSAPVLSTTPSCLTPHIPAASSNTPYSQNP
jgi:hypothetical protein